MTVRWGLIGASTIAREWVIGAIRAAGGEIVAVMSADAGRGRGYAGANGIPNASHRAGRAAGGARSTRSTSPPPTNCICDRRFAAAKAGKHVLCEKPLALTVADARSMVEACRAAGVVMATNHHLRNAGTHRAMRDAIAAGRIGRPLFAGCSMPSTCRRICKAGASRRPAPAAGVMLDITVHDADTLRFVLGEEPVEVIAMVQHARYGRRAGSRTARWASSASSPACWHSSTTPSPTKFAGTGFEVHGTEGR